jgi:hypothetical protein
VNAVQHGRAGLRGLEFRPFDGFGGVGNLLEGLEQRELGVLLLGFLLRGRRVNGLFPEQVFRALGESFPRDAYRSSIFSQNLFCSFGLLASRSRGINPAR